jgi:hypothetical protein
VVQQVSGASTATSAGASEVIGIFPNHDAIVPLVNAVLAEHHDEWQVTRRYMSLESLATARVVVIDGQGNDVGEELMNEPEEAS